MIAQPRNDKFGIEVFHIEYTSGESSSSSRQNGDILGQFLLLFC